MYCVNCGKSIRDGARFCVSCGTPAVDSPGADIQDTPGAVPSDQATAPLETTAPMTEPAPIPVQAPATPPAFTPAQPPTSTRTSGGEGRISYGLTSAIVLVVMALTAVGIHYAYNQIYLPTVQPQAQVVEEEAIPAVQPSTSSAATEQQASSSASTPSSTGQSAATDTGTTSTPQPSAAAQTPVSSDYVLPDSATRLYSRGELEPLDNFTLYVARNEIFARHGRIFSNQDLRDYFGSKSWYHGTIDPKDFDAGYEAGGYLNDTERANVNTIKDVEQARGSSYLTAH